MFYFLSSLLPYLDDRIQVKENESGEHNKSVYRVYFRLEFYVLSGVILYILNHISESVNFT